MLLLAVLILVGLGALIGAAGMRRLGALGARAAGRWRPGVGVGALMLVFAGLALTARGAVLFGLSSLAAGVLLALGARKRPSKVKGDAPPSALSENEARAVLGVGPQATAEEIQAAYIRLMQKAHPDRGGTSGLASQLNAARSRLLG